MAIRWLELERVSICGRVLFCAGDEDAHLLLELMLILIL
jgi:hypothetical protein